MAAECTALGTDGLSMQFSPWGFIDLLIPGHPGLATVVGFSAALLGVAAFVIFYRHHRGEWQLLFAASIVATLWISPHVNAYDWVLLIAALAVLWRSRPASAGVWMSAAIVLAFGSLWSILLTNLMRDGLGWAIKLAVPILAMVAWLVARHLRTNRQSGLAPITVRHFSPTQPM